MRTAPPLRATATTACFDAGPSPAPGAADPSLPDGRIGCPLTRPANTAPAVGYSPGRWTGRRPPPTRSADDRSRCRGGSRPVGSGGVARGATRPVGQAVGGGAVHGMAQQHVGSAGVVLDEDAVDEAA